MKNIQCPLCGTFFDPMENLACPSCPLHDNCTMTCCPTCGHTTVDPGKSRLARWASRLLSLETPDDPSSER